MGTKNSEKSIELITVTRVAKTLGVCRSKVYQLMDTGSLPYIKLGKCRRIRSSDVYRLIEQNTVTEPGVQSQQKKDA